MSVQKYTLLKGLLASLIALGLATGCTTYNPALSKCYKEQQ